MNLNLNFGQFFDADAWLRFCPSNLCSVEILKLKVDHDLYKNLWYNHGMTIGH